MPSWTRSTRSTRGHGRLQPSRSTSACWTSRKWMASSRRWRRSTPPSERRRATISRWSPLLAPMRRYLGAWANRRTWRRRSRRWTWATSSGSWATSVRTRGSGRLRRRSARRSASSSCTTAPAPRSRSRTASRSSFQRTRPRSPPPMGIVTARSSPRSCRAGRTSWTRTTAQRRRRAGHRFCRSPRSARRRGQAASTTPRSFRSTSPAGTPSTSRPPSSTS